MKSLARAGDRAAILVRIRAVRAESGRRWGRMSPHEMVCHLSDSFRMALGQRDVKLAPTLLPRSALRIGALYLPVPWPRGFPTRPELDQQRGGTRPAEFAADAAALEALLEDFTAE